MKRFLKIITFPFLSWWYKKRNDKIQRYSKHGIHLLIYPSVFHPGLFFSTQFFVQFFESFELKNATFLELGAGSGFISFWAAKNGAIVTATDINPQSIDGLNENSRRNNLPIQVIESNLFEKIRLEDYDIIAINPPYYPKEPSNFAENAFFCGNDFDYFHQLFQQISTQYRPTTFIYMILSEDCDIEKIQKIASENELKLVLKRTLKNWCEENYIYEIMRYE